MELLLQLAAAAPLLNAARTHIPDTKSLPTRGLYPLHTTSELSNLFRPLFHNPLPGSNMRSF
jgi:hypothetical protein